MESPLPRFDSTLGALFLGHIGSAVLFGITSVQAYLYFNKYPRDKPLLKTLSSRKIALLWILDGVHFAFITYGQYFYCVSNFGNPGILTTPVWSLASQAIVTCFSEATVRATDRVIGTLMLYTVNTCLLTCIWGFMCLIAHIVWPSTAVYIGMFFLIPELSLNALLATLNARSHLRERSLGVNSAISTPYELQSLERGLTSSSKPNLISRPTGDEMAINVEKHVTIQKDQVADRTQAILKTLGWKISTSHLRHSKMSQHQPKVWLITGSSSGFGRLMAEHVVQQGDIAVATARIPETLDELKAKYSSDKLLILKCDVTSKQDVSDAFKAAYEKFGRIDVVFNNAGVFYIAEVEIEEQAATAQEIFNTNFWGAVNVIKEAIHSFRDLNQQRGGHLINVSSYSTSGIPGIGYYNASKGALEALTSSVTNEIDPEWNIKTTIVIPGACKTRVLEVGGVKIYPPHPAYDKETLPTIVGRSAFAVGVVPGSNPLQAMQKVYRLSKLEKPPLYFPVGKDAVQVLQGYAKRLCDDIAAYGTWSEDMEMWH
ncbi:hypothetical protein ONZ45_g8288 [Pleurotus djamor]|nr:hypothetical protein ONZ45_g8288 [Pleurotus djamor]